MTPSSGDKTIFEKIGGATSVDAAVERFYEKVLGDSSLSHFFRGVDIPKLKRLQKEFFTQVLGGSKAYSGRDMKSSHESLPIRQEDFDRVAGHLVATLQELGVSAELIDEIVGKVAPLAKVIVKEELSQNKSPRFRWTIGKKLFGLGFLGLAVAMAVGIDGYSGINRVVGSLNDSLLYSDAVRNHLESDMMHDALRGDVLAALLAETEESKGAVRADLKEHVENFRARLQANNALPLDEEIHSALGAAAPAIEEYLAAAEHAVAVGLDDKEAGKTALPEFLESFERLEEKMAGLSDLILDRTKKTGANSQTAIEASRFWMIAIWALGVSVLSVAVFFVSRTIVRSLRATVTVLESVAAGDLTSQASVRGSDEIAQMSEALNKTVAGIRTSFNASKVDWEQIAQERLDLDRVVSMVENAPINMMFADSNLVIRYMNPASLRTLRGLQKLLPLPVDQIVGKSMDIFHKNPSHQRRILSDSKNLPHKAQFSLGEETLDLLATAIYDKKGKQLGVMATWAVITENVAAARREKEMMDNLKEVLSGVAKNANSLSAASEELSSVSSTMTDNSSRTANEAQSVSSAAEQVSKSVQTVAAGAEEMTASIREISKNASESAKVASEAVRVAQATNVTVSKLGDSSQEIGEVVKLINSIAEQTNLLALNATIEAARAGEAGKGFAVVANEVKELAKETSKATENISQKIEGIQDDTKKAVEAITEISGVINKINDLSNSIASAVEEQTATTNEIGRSLGEAARGSSEIVQSVTAVAQAAQSTTSGATDTQRAAAELARMSSELQQIVGRLKG